MAIRLKKLVLPLSLVLCMSCGTGSAENVERGNTGINTNDTGKTVIRLVSTDTQYPNNSILLISSKGTVAVCDPYRVLPGIHPDIVTVTHNHPDHNDFTGLSGGRISRYTVETFTVDDVRVTSLASSHMGNVIDNTNTIYVYEIDGLRIAHMGDIGQLTLTSGQLAVLGSIDIAFMQFVNSYSGYSAENERGAALIEQLKPQIIIPTHSSAAAAARIGEIVGSIESASNSIVVGKSDLADGKRRVINLINNN